MQIRDAVEEDFDEITAIYNEVLTNTTAIYNDRPTTCEERTARWRMRQDKLLELFQTQMRWNALPAR